MSNLPTDTRLHISRSLWRTWKTIESTRRSIDFSLWSSIFLYLINDQCRCSLLVVSETTTASSCQIDYFSLSLFLTCLLVFLSSISDDTRAYAPVCKTSISMFSSLFSSKKINEFNIVDFEWRHWAWCSPNSWATLIHSTASWPSVPSSS